MSAPLALSRERLQSLWDTCIVTLTAQNTAGSQVKDRDTLGARPDAVTVETRRATMTLGMAAKQLGDWCDRQTGVEGSSGVSARPIGVVC